MYGECFICKEFGETEVHHAFAGRGLRPLSERYHATVRLCPYCHRINPAAVHNSRETREYIQDYSQRKVMREQGWSEDEFRKVFGKSYLRGEDEEEQRGRIAAPSCATVRNDREEREEEIFGFRILEDIPLFC